jgi:ABC-2 type transport system permease protein
MMQLYLKYAAIILKGQMQDKASFFFGALGQALASLSSFFAVYFIFYRFKTVKGFSFSEVLLCFSISLISFSFAECFARGFDRFAVFISDGTFDRMLVRPRNAVFQVAASTMEFSRIGRFIEAAIVFVYALSTSGIPFSAGRIAALIMMFTGSCALFSGMFVLYAALCFFTLEGLEFINIFTDGAREFGEYPLAVYGKRVLKFCTFVIPYALVQYYPFLYVTGRSSCAWYILLPLAGIVFLLPCYVFWRFGMRHYVSTGS